jgi:L-aspartate oxidase
VLGGGLAGLRASLAVESSRSVLVINKDNLDESSSQWAQGGIASVIDPADRFDNHIADTIAAGGDLCNPGVVDSIVREAPARIAELIQWGTKFDKRDGELELGKEGGHSHHRIVHALGDATGREVMRAVIQRAKNAKNIDVWPDTFTIDLVTHRGVCRGAIVWHPQRGKTMIWAKKTILATGGAGQVFRESTNPAGASGDGIALAWRAGAVVRDMEFMQFHPTVLYIAGGSRSLITEAVRGAGAYLVDRDGHRFMSQFDERAELAPRDIVSKAITEVMRRTSHSNVYLDLSHLESKMVRERFPGMDKICREFGLDLATDRIPVRPGAHYMIGGVAVDADGQTSIPNLFAAGEVASSGLHGANRLASNSLLEGLVFGSRAGEQVTQELKSAFQQNEDGNALDVPFLAHARAVDQIDASGGDPLDVSDIRNSLRSLMWRHVGVERSGDSLQEALQTVDSWCRYVLQREFSEPQGWQLQNLLEVGRLMIYASLARTESRGVHVRSDYPETSNDWRVHLCWQREKPNPWRTPVDSVSLAVSGAGDCLVERIDKNKRNEGVS